MQSVNWSVIETITSVVLGYLIGLVAQMLLFPLYGIEINLVTNLWLSLWFTIIALIRSFLIRRLFNFIGG